MDDYANKPDLILEGNEDGKNCISPRALLLNRQWTTGLVVLDMDTDGLVTLPSGGVDIELCTKGNTESMEDAGGGTSDTYDTVLTSLLKGGFFSRNKDYRIKSAEIQWLKPYYLITTSAQVHLGSSNARALTNGALHDAELIKILETQLLAQVEAPDDAGEAPVGPISFFPAQTGLSNADAASNGAPYIGNVRQLPLNLIVRDGNANGAKPMVFRIKSGAMGSIGYQTDEDPSAATKLVVPVRVIFNGEIVGSDA